jgi:hypothetical protein
MLLMGTPEVAATQIWRQQLILMPHTRICGEVCI